MTIVCTDCGTQATSIDAYHDTGHDWGGPCPLRILLAAQGITDSWAVVRHLRAFRALLALDRAAILDEARRAAA